MPFAAHVSAHASQRDDHLREALGVLLAGGRVAVPQRHLVVLREQFGKPRDLLNRRATDLARPSGCFRYAVVDALDVILEVLGHLRVGRHGFGIEPHAAAVKEIPVDDIAPLPVQPQHLIGHGGKEGAVGAHAHRHPRRIERGCRGVVHGTHRNELDPVSFHVHQKIRRKPRRRPHGVASVEDDRVGSLHGETVVAFVLQIRVPPIVDRRRETERPFGAGTPVAHVAAHEVEHGAGRGHAAQPRMQNRPSPIRLVGVAQFFGHQLYGLVNADALPFVASAQAFVAPGMRLPVLALHGVFDAVRPQHVLPLRVTARAGTLLRVQDAVFVGVVGLLPDHLAIHHIGVVGALAAAVVPAGNRHPCPRTLDDGFVRIAYVCHRAGAALRRSPRARLRGAASQQRRRRRGRRCGRRPLDEGPAAQLLRCNAGFVRHGFPLSSPSLPGAPKPSASPRGAAMPLW